MHREAFSVGGLRAVREHCTRIENGLHKITRRSDLAKLDLPPGLMDELLGTLARVRAAIGGRDYRRALVEHHTAWRLYEWLHDLLPSPYFEAGRQALREKGALVRRLKAERWRIAVRAEHAQLLTDHQSWSKQSRRKQSEEVLRRLIKSGMEPPQPDQRRFLHRARNVQRALFEK